MPLRARLRALVMRAALAALLLGAALMLISAVWYVSLARGDRGLWLRLERGGLYVQTRSGIPGGLDVRLMSRLPDARPWAWWPLDYGSGMGRLVRVPLWMPTALAAALFAAARWAPARRVIAGRCARCGYDRRGLLAAAACPECGAPGLSRPSTHPPAS